jgi:formylglycine-generating enzyme required for sulfatase activity
MDQEGDGVMARFRAQFVQVPPGMLPDGTQIAAMEADRYPVTREFWNEIMGGMPEHVPAANRVTWNDAPRVPVTFVSWENQNGSPAEVQGFLARLNEREQATGCVYDLPTDQQLWYLIRGDVTGQNRDLYSAGVIAANVNEFVTYYGNSNPDGTGNQIQSVGNKTSNRFGIELGNVWKMSKDLHSPAQRSHGRSIRGGGWNNDINFAESGVRSSAYAGYRFDYVGLALVRSCN